MHAAKLMELIANTIDLNNMTTANNCLMCATDLIAYHPELLLNCMSSVINTIASFLQNNNINRVYTMNFARMLGRLFLVDPKQAKAYLHHNIKNICLGLRCSEHSQLSDDAFQGVFQTIR
eukprot:GHVR01092481.1.p1 GENE.GHVR01092481.1~~GHVR01092481.1.p1  ORF type:complete len:120 (-),score=3.00 GHVR01092481.1:1255-1614(-)